MRARNSSTVVAAVVGLVALASFVAVTESARSDAGRATADRPAAPLSTREGAPADAPRQDPAGWTMRRVSHPDRVLVRDSQGLLATFSLGARTVVVRGTERTFREPLTTSARVTTTTRVRLLPRPFAGTVDEDWLTESLADISPDVLDVAMQYVTGAPTINDARGRLTSSDASFGPLRADGGREEGSDVADYLGRAQQYSGVLDTPEAPQRGAMDCSGFVRMVFGYRSGMPMVLDQSGDGLPRRAWEIFDNAPGLTTIPNRGARPPSLDRLLPGDLVFFDLTVDNGSSQVGHMGIYIGLDEVGGARFVSSRMLADGPTLGDLGGAGVLNGAGLYGSTWRGARRL